MIGPEHLEYQHGPDADHNWVETFYFPVLLPEEHIWALIYVNVRPTLGVMWNQVIVCGALIDSPSEYLHYAENFHLPAPSRLSHIDSPLGLSIKALEPPRAFRLDYQSTDATAINVDWTGIMDPFDSYDPRHSPQAGKVSEIHADVTAGDTKSNAGHFDMTGRVTGELRIRGRTFQVDSLTRMDHSWGLRDPMKGGKSVYICSPTFGDSLAFHFICPWKPHSSSPDEFTLTHGYVLDEGDVFGLTSEISMSSSHKGIMCTAIDIEVHDVRKRTYHLTASPDIGGPWHPTPSALSHLAMMKWRCEGRDGYGTALSFYLLPDLNRTRGRFQDDPPPII